MRENNMKEITENLIEKAKKFLNDIEIYNMNIEYVLLDEKDIKNSQVIALYEDGEFGYILTPETEDYTEIIEWDYSFDEYIFAEFKKGKKITYMSDETHYAIWESLKELYPEDIEHKKGVQDYLKYCKENGITKEYLQKAINRENIEDAMKHYKETKSRGRER